MPAVVVPAEIGSEYSPELLTPEAIDAWWDGLSVVERRALDQSLSTRVAPNPGPQTEAYLSLADDMGYGGAAGCGKSFLFVLLGLNVHKNTIIFRFDGSQLRQLVDDFVEAAGTDVGLNRQQGIFRLLAGRRDDGRPIFRTITFAGLGKPGEKDKFQGRANDLQGFDEATEIGEDNISFLHTWNRSPDPNQRVRRIMTFNPPNKIKAMWLLEHFAAWLDDQHPHPAKPGEIRYYYRNEEGEEIETLSPASVVLHLHGKKWVTNPISRTFIPARLEDNPYQDSRYSDRLMALPPEERDRVRFGIISRRPNDDPYQVLPTLWIEGAQARWKPEGESTTMDAIGIDVARGGENNTVLSRRHGWWWNKLVRHPGKDTPDGHAVAASFIQYRKNDADACIDANGVGASPADILGQTFPTFPVTGQTRTGIPRIDQHLKMFNLRTALWWLFRKILDPGHNLLPALPPDKRLRTQLSAPTYEIRGGVVQVQPKEDVIALLGISPDDADAVVTSLANVFTRQPHGIGQVVFQFQHSANAAGFIHRQNQRYRSPQVTGHPSQRKGGWQSR